jgi:hypothetical protein
VEKGDAALQGHRPCLLGILEGIRTTASPKSNRAKGDITYCAWKWP